MQDYKTKKKNYNKNNGVKMRRLLLFAAGLAFLLLTFMPTQQLNAQVYGEFNGIGLGLNRPFVAMEDPTEVIPANRFGMPPTNTTDLDDGYALVQLDKFGFEFNGEVYNQLWISINGFITFGKKAANGTIMPPPNLTAATRDPRGLFWDGASYPVNVIAPYWGDHHYRPDSVKFRGYAPTTISYKSENDKFTIEWKNLNINFRPDYKASVADFQLVLYKSVDPLSSQGDIEFIYGTVGKRPFQNQYWDPAYDNKVVVDGASVGIKGEGIGVGIKADFLNALYNGGRIPYNEVLSKTAETLTTEWAPSSSGNKSIIMVAKTRFNVDEWWGDGDVDFSKTFGKPHYLKPQNRFVTINDARLIMKAVAMNIPLDSIRRRAAYHADVNHNGRFYYNNMNVRTRIPWRTMNYLDSINRLSDVSSLKQILFEANEYDAAMIISYISAKVPELPWLLDTFPNYGKVNNEIASLKFGQIKQLNSNTYQIPVLVDGIFDGPIGAKFNLDASVASIVANEKDGNNIIAMNNNDNNTVVISGNGQFNASEPIAYLTLISDNSNINISGIRFNDKEIENVNYKLLGETIYSSNEVMLQNVPNPVVSSTNISLNIAANSVYTLGVYDTKGNMIKSLFSGSLASGVHNFDWNTTDELGNKVDSGVYFYRLTGNGETFTKKMVVSK